MKWLALALLLGALALPAPAAAKSDVYLYYRSPTVDGITVISFQGINGAARTSGAPSIGWVEGYTDIDCDWTGFWCGGVQFVQEGQTFTAEWI
jgi:hypothetical protein